MTSPPQYEGGLEVVGEWQNYMHVHAKVVYPDGTEVPIAFDWPGTLLVIITMIALPLQAWTMPQTLKYFKPQ